MLVYQMVLQYISRFKNIDRYKSHEEISRLKSYHEELLPLSSHLDESLGTPALAQRPSWLSGTPHVPTEPSAGDGELSHNSAWEWLSRLSPMMYEWISLDARTWMNMEEKTKTWTPPYCSMVKSHLGDVIGVLSCIPDLDKGK